jgi:hypothetical protein
MFKKFGKEEISGYTQVKASVARGIRCKQQSCQHTSLHPVLHSCGARHLLHV